MHIHASRRPETHLQRSITSVCSAAHYTTLGLGSVLTYQTFGTRGQCPQMLWILRGSHWLHCVLCPLALNDGGS